MSVEDQKFLKTMDQRVQKVETHSQLLLPLKLNICIFKETGRNLRRHLIVSRGASGRILLFFLDDWKDLYKI